MLAPGDSDLLVMDSTNLDLASGGVLNDPTGFGVRPGPPKTQPGIIGDSAPEDDYDMEDLNHHKEPSVKGALSELHHAVSDKLQSWNPYFVKPLASGVVRANKTAVSSGEKPVNTTTAASLGESIKDGISEDGMLGARTRIGKCTILFNGNSFWERAIRTHERHDREHGYRLHVLRQHLMDDVWSKPAYILSLLLRELSKPESDRLEWLFWVDADTIILNPYIPIEVFLPPPGSEFEDIHLMYSNDWNGLNNGVFPVRVSQWSVQLFSAITSFRHYRPDDPLQFRDQSAMDVLMKEPAFIDNIVQAPQRWFNAYQGEHNETLAPFQIRRGDFLVHFAGVPNREERMGYWLNRAEQHLDDWEVPVKSTSYLQEVRDFWAEQSGMRRAKKESLAEQRLKAKEILSKVEQDFTDYGDRLSEENKIELEKDRDELRTMLDNEMAPFDPAKMEEAMGKLTEAAKPLTEAIGSAQKMLLTAAHEAIISGERDLLEGGYGDGVSNPEMVRISESVKSLKELVMTPQEHWNRHDISLATNAVTLARARLQEKTVAMIKDSQASKDATDIKKQGQGQYGVGGARNGSATVGDGPQSVTATDAMATTNMPEAESQAESVPGLLPQYSDLPDPQ